MASQHKKPTIFKMTAYAKRAGLVRFSMANSAAFSAATGKVVATN